MSVLKRIFQWSESRPAWQRDALRGLVRTGRLSDSDIKELLQICRREAGIDAPGARAPVPLTAKDLGAFSQTSEAVRLSAIRDLTGVNALVQGASLTFAKNGVTAVYGDNGAGKSGYARILKKVCRARCSEASILPNVFSQQEAANPEATVDYLFGTDERTHRWKLGQRAPNELQDITVFDSSCAAVYVENENDVAYRPLGLDVLHKLADACGRLKRDLTSELSKLRMSMREFPALVGETEVGKLVRNLGDESADSSIEELANLDAGDLDRLTTLRTQVARFDAEDPAIRAAELHVRSKRLSDLATRIAKVEANLSAEQIKNFEAASTDAHHAQVAADLAREAAFGREPLTNVGSDTWRALWDAARSYSEKEAYPGSRFPFTGDGARCVLCQQRLDDEASDRLSRFDRFLREASQRRADETRERFQQMRASFQTSVIGTPDDRNVIAELRMLDGEAASLVEQYLDAAEHCVSEINAACESSDWISVSSPGSAPTSKLFKLARDARDQEAKCLQAKIPEHVHRMRLELAELEARKALANLKTEILQEAKRQRYAGKLERAIDLTDTTGITRKNTELTRAAVTEVLRKRFDSELSALGLGYLRVSVNPTGGHRGLMYHRIEFTNARPGEWGIGDVLSEGEHRAIALAAMLAELEPQESKSALVFDDPVSSLDHLRREVVARRLVEIARERQVIVLTHDHYFLLLLQDLSDQLQVEFVGRCLVRSAGGLGVPIDGVHWHAMPTRRRIAYLKDECQRIEKVSRTQEAQLYEREAIMLYGLLREAWERAVEEVLLYGVVVRFGRTVQTQKLRYLTDILPDDITTVDQAMAKCSALLPGHDEAAMINAPVPQPTEIAEDIALLESWVASLRKRRN